MSNCFLRLAAIYKVMPQAAQTRLAKVHFWLYNLGLPVQMLVLSLYLGGNKAVAPILGMVSILVGLSVVCWAVNLWRHTACSPQP